MARRRPTQRVENSDRLRFFLSSVTEVAATRMRCQPRPSIALPDPDRENPQTGSLTPLTDNMGPQNVASGKASLTFWGMRIGVRMERASKPYRRRRCSLGAQACHSPSSPRDGSESRAIGSEVQLQARQPRRPDLICPTPSMAPRSLPVRRVGSGAETCPVCTRVCLCMAASRAYSGRRSGSWSLRGAL